MPICYWCTNRVGVQVEGERHTMCLPCRKQSLTCRLCNYYHVEYESMPVLTFPTIPDNCVMCGLEAKKKKPVWKQQSYSSPKSSILRKRICQSSS